MPITQDRMIALCTEGLAHRQAFVRLRDSLLSILREHRNDPLMAITLIEGTIATLHPPAADNLIAETVHWRYHRKENEKNRERMRRRRDTSPNPINAPTTLVRPLAEADFEGLDFDIQAEYEKWNKGES